MNANDLLTPEMTLDEKLAAIDAALLKAPEQEIEAKKNGTYLINQDPMDALWCQSCQ